MSVALNGAIREALVGDATLVTLTGNSDTAPIALHIGRNMPQVKQRKPFLGFDIRESIPGILDAMTRLQVATVEFNCIAEEDLLAMQIADRLEYLLHREDSDNNTAYFDISNANVSNRQTNFLSREQPEYDEDVDYWMVTVVAAFWWINQPCPV